MTHRMKSLFLGCLLFGQFYCHLGAMTKTYAPVEKFLQWREQVRLHGAQVPFNSILRREIVDYTARQKEGYAVISSATKFHNKILCLSLALLLLNFLYCSMRYHYLKKHYERLAAQCIKNLRHNQLIENKVLAHLPAGFTTQDFGAQIAEYLDYTSLLKSKRASVLGEGPEKLNNLKLFYQNAHFVALLSYYAYCSLLLGLILMIFYGTIFIIIPAHIMSLMISMLIYGKNAAFDTFSLMLFHNYDRNLLTLLNFFCKACGMILISSALSVCTYGRQ